MLYIVEAALDGSETDEEWDAWVGDMKPPRIILSVPGVGSAQRFKGVGMRPAAYLALYSVARAAVLQTPRYFGVGGGRLGTRPDRWNGRVRFWRRDLFSGLRDAPAIGPDQRIAILDRRADEGGETSPAGLPFRWLRIAGLDRSTALRGLAVLTAAEADSFSPGVVPGLRLYRPIMPRQLPSRSASSI